jgi:hypothetical protein
MVSAGFEIDTDFAELAVLKNRILKCAAMGTTLLAVSAHLAQVSA